MAAVKERNFLQGRCHFHPVCQSPCHPSSTEHGVPLMTGIRFVDDCFTQYIYLRHNATDRRRAEDLAEHFRIHAFPPSCILEVEPPAPAHTVCGCRFVLGEHGLDPHCHLQSKNLELAAALPLGRFSPSRMNTPTTPDPAPPHDDSLLPSRELFTIATRPLWH